MPVTGNNLRGYGFRDQAHFLGDVGFDAGVDISEGAHRARNGAGGDLRAGDLKTLAAAGEFSVVSGQLDPECRRFGVDAVTAADTWRELELPSPQF